MPCRKYKAGLIVSLAVTAGTLLLNAYFVGVVWPFIFEQKPENYVRKRKEKKHKGDQ